MVALQAPVQSYDRPGAIEATLKDMDNIYQYQTIARHNKICAELKFRGDYVFWKATKCPILFTSCEDDDSCTVNGNILHLHGTFTWRRHQMEAFSGLLALFEGNQAVTG